MTRWEEELLVRIEISTFARTKGIKKGHLQRHPKQAEAIRWERVKSGAGKRDQWEQLQSDAPFCGVFLENDDKETGLVMGCSVLTVFKSNEARGT